MLDALNLALVVVYATEALLKMVCLGLRYFLNPWNVFDFSVVALAIGDIFLRDLFRNHFVPPLLLKIVGPVLAKKKL